MSENFTRVKINFYGGAGSVTGANFLLEEDNGIKILFDCGLVQGAKDDPINTGAFPYDPSKIDYLIVSHAHIDHIGRIPKLVKEGFRGRILSTPPTREISDIMLVDSLGILGKEAKYNKRDPIYDEEDVRLAMTFWDEGIPYHKTFDMGNFRVTFKDSGHILGSTITELVYNGKKIVYTGDLGNSPSVLLKDTEVITDADYLIMESVYGDRNHESHNVSRDMLEDAIENTVRANGVLMIPAFSIEKTQEILFEINKMMEESRIPLVKVFLDSPLAIKVTDIYKKYKSYFNDSAMKEYAFHPNDGIFAFPQLLRTLTTEESIAIKNYSNPKIVIAGSGMSNGGRILHHEKNYLPDKRSTLILTGYQSVGTLGRLIQEGAKTVRIMGEEVRVKANVVSITGYSGHKGSDALLDFVSHTADKVKKVFVVLGEPKSSLFLVQRIRDNLAIDASSPNYGDSYYLD
ncbi:MAG: MBL fold metallo-hydrolase [Candidatus Vogelbacteria bacterium]|nr:MBL fold metallo-hydrolase [Candidatus Vogelbacteria bacterium]